MRLEKGAQLVLGSTPQYSRLKYTLKGLCNGEYRSYMGKNIYILSDSQAVIRTINNFQINSKQSGSAIIP